MKIETRFVDLNKLPWHSIMSCGDDYKSRFPGDNNEHFGEYLLQEWGIDIISRDVSVVDEIKYSMFLLKWS
jgi:hypothetical protein